jgi:hypothetical protein
VHFGFFSQQVVYRFAVHLIRNAAIYRANGCALGFFVEALALSAFVWGDIVRIHADRRKTLFGAYSCSIHQGKIAFDGRSVSDRPLNAAFIDRVIRTFGLAGAAIDTLFGNFDCHTKWVCWVSDSTFAFQKYGCQMILQERIELMGRLGQYMLGDSPDWAAAKERAYRENPWFVPEFVEVAVKNIAHAFLDPSFLQDWAADYGVPEQQAAPKTVGLVMAGNIPLVGFHDFLCVFISGHAVVMKTSSKDEVLIKHLVKKLYEWEITIQNTVSFAERLNNCDAYIATGSNNSGRYFDYYFGKYPHIIRRNRTSVAILDGTETPEELDALSADIQLYFGLGCRNITQLFVPKEYDFLPLLNSLRKYEHFLDFHKYKHNYDYHLALLIMGNKYYMNNDSIILTENTSPFSPVSQVHYTFYADKSEAEQIVQDNNEIQCVVGHSHLPFGTAQRPSLGDYADGVDTMGFLMGM